MSKKYTISDIAKLVGVSKGTVDRVIHERGKVSKTAYEKVTKILKEINYQPNLIARNLKKNKIYRIAVVLPNPEIDGYWVTCIDAIDTILSEFQAFGIAIESHFFDPKSTDSFSEAHTIVLKSKPEAVLLAPLFKKEALNAIENYTLSHILVATFNNRIDTLNNKSFIGQNLHQSGRVAAKLLANSIYTKGDLVIVHIDEKYKQALYIQEKEKGFRNYFESFPLLQNKIITLKLKRTNLEKQIVDFLKRNTNLAGIFVSTSKAYEIIPLIKKYATHKIAVVGYDLLPENIEFLKDESIDFLIHQNPKQQVYLGLKTLAEHLLFDKEISSQILLPIDIINSENVDLFLKR